MTIPSALPVEVRSAGTVGEVDRRERIIDLVVVPYNEITEVPYNGQMIEESVLPGAFAGIEVRDANRDRFVVYRDHYGSPVGMARSVKDTSDCLVASVRISPTTLGDDTLVLAEEGVLQPSVGMRVYPKDQRWSLGNRRRQITRAMLDHIALVPQQAYVGARVLAVRSADGVELEQLWTPPATPLLDDVLAYTARVEAELRSARGA